MYEICFKWHTHSGHKQSITIRRRNKKKTDHKPPPIQWFGMEMDSAIWKQFELEIIVVDNDMSQMNELQFSISPFLNRKKNGF